MSRLWIVGLTGAAALWVAAPARGDGVMMPVITEVGQSPPMVASPRQEAVLATDGKTVQVVLRTHFRAGPRELAWVVPVPAKPSRVEKGDAEVFAKLEAMTAPRFYRVSRSSKGGPFACGCAAGRSGATVSLPRSVVVVSSGTAGIFKYAVLSATKADDLTRWLNENEYFVPVGAERVFQRYVEDGWHWLAMRVRPEVADKPTLAPHPITYTYRDTKLVYPLEISRLSADLKNEIVLYVVAGCRFACANWANATIEPKGVAPEKGAPSGTNYERLFGGLCEARRGRVFVTELAKSKRFFGYEGDSYQINSVVEPALLKALGPEQTLTRLRAVMTPAAMDRDVALLPSPQWPPVENSFHQSAVDRPGGSAIALAFPLIPLALLCVGLGLAARPGWWRAASILCITTACLGLAMM